MENNEKFVLKSYVLLFWWYNSINNILIEKKSLKNILIYVISYKTLTSSKPMWIIFNKVDGIIRIHDRTRYDTVYDRIRCLISLKISITNIFSHYFAKIKVGSYDSSSKEKILTLYNVIILIKSVLNKDKNHYYYKDIFRKMFLSIS